MPGVPERRTHGYIRNGTTNLYAALDVASGHVIADMTPRHRAEEFRRFSNLVDRSVPEHPDVHGVLDNFLDPQDAVDPAVAASPPPLHPALHPHLQPLARPGRALVRRADHQMDQAGRPPIGAGARRLHPHVDHRLE